MKRVFIVHGWGGQPHEHWLPWLKKQLESKAFSVTVPAMPDTDNPKIENWVPALAKAVGTPDKDTYFVGHSIGCQTIMRYLETINATVGGCVFVAGWFTLQGLETEGEEATAKPWITTKIDFTKVKKATTKFSAFFSDDDPYVPVSDEALFKKNLGAETVMEHQKGHFTKGDGVADVPEVLEAVLKLSR